MLTFKLIDSKCTCIGISFYTYTHCLLQQWNLKSNLYPNTNANISNENMMLMAYLEQYTTCCPANVLETKESLS